MNLPACYLADLPEGAPLTPDLITDACLVLARNRLQHLKSRSTESMIRDVANAAALWREPRSPFLQAALTPAAQDPGVAPATLRDGLLSVFSAITEDSLRCWIEQDLGHPRRLDDFCGGAAEQVTARRAMAFGPALLVHFTAGNLPAPAVLSMVAGLLLRSAQFVKCASGSSRVPTLFAHSVRRIDPGLGSCLEVAEWSSKRHDLDHALLTQADGVTVTGSDESVGALRGRVAVPTLFAGHGHKVSFIFLCREMLGGGQGASTLQGVAKDVVAWNQIGCLSPHVVYVERDGPRSPEEWAGDLAGLVHAAEATHPRGAIPPSDAAVIRSRRSFYEVRAAHSRDTRLWASHDSTAWTVVYEDHAQFQLSCLYRFIYVKAVADLDEALQGADAVRRHVSCVGLAAPAARQHALARRLAEWGVTRICPVGRMQAPPLPWRHDGRPALAELVRWVDWESEDRL